MTSRADDSTLSQQLVPSAGRAHRPSSSPPVDPAEPFDDKRLRLQAGQEAPSMGRRRRPPSNPPADPIDERARLHLSCSSSLPDVDGPGPGRRGPSRLTTRGELPVLSTASFPVVVAVPEQPPPDRRRVLFAAYAVLFVRCGIAT